MHAARNPASKAFRRLLFSSLVATAAMATSIACAETLEEQLTRGEEQYAEHCAICHGDAGEGGAGYPNAIVGSRNLDKFRNAKRLFDYHRMMMPFDDPSKMTAEEKWDVTAYLMDLNDWLGELDAPLGPDNAEDIAIGAN